MTGVMYKKYFANILIFIGSIPTAQDHVVYKIYFLASIEKNSFFRYDISGYTLTH